MSDSTWWWLLGGVLVASELLSGTFLLLMLASGAAAGALAAHAGWNLTSQIVVAALVGALAAIAWYVIQKKRPRRPSALGQSDTADTALDIGQSLHVDAWQADGSTQVSYRGARWSARYRPSGPQDMPAAGMHRICGMQGNLLILEKI